MAKERPQKPWQQVAADEEKSNTREFRGVLGNAVTVFAVGFSLYHILYITGTLSRLGMFIQSPQHLALHLGSVMALVFALVPFRKGASRKLPWYDAILLVVAFGWNLYIFIAFEAIYLRSFFFANLMLVQSVMVWIFLILVLEAGRRAVGLSVSLIGALFLIYPLVSDRMPGILAGAGYSWERVARGVGLFVPGMYGDILNISGTIVFSFMLFSQVLFISGAGQWFIDISRSLLGHVRGGPAKVAVLASSLMGTIQGTAVGNVVSVGVFTIPLMKKAGYPAHLAGAIEAAASNGGQIMPPVMGIAAFIMTDFLGVGYERIMLAATIPALLYYAAVYFTVDFEAAKAGLVGMPRSELPPIWKTFSRGWLFIIPLSVLLVCLIFLRFSPQLSALYSAAVLVVVSYFKPGNWVTPNKLVKAMKDAALSMMMVAVVCAIAGIIVASVELTGLSYRLSFLLTQVAGDNLGLLLVLTAVVCIVLGMGMPTSAVYILLAVLVAPALVKLGMLPIAAHFFVFYLGVAALITPPVCPASYVAAGIARAPPLRTAFTACRLAIATFVVPFIFAYRPELLMQGPIGSILLTTLTTTILIISISAGLGGYLLKPLNLASRALLTAGSLTMLYPAAPATVIGLVMIAAVVFHQLLAQVRAVTHRVQA